MEADRELAELLEGILMGNLVENPALFLALLVVFTEKSVERTIRMALRDIGVTPEFEVKFDKFLRELRLE